MKILQLIRWKNIAIVSLTQLLAWYGVILPVMQHNNITPIMGWYDIFLLIVATQFITASGNIINDIFDVEADKINKPGKNLVGSKIPLKRANSLYWFTTLHGFMLAEILAIRLGNYQIGLVFLFISGLLWIYSSRVKGWPISGNVLIALLTASVVLILLFFEVMAQQVVNTYIPMDIEAFRSVANWTLGLAAFAFSLNLLREIIKDMEDIEGDLAVSCRTFPVIFGLKKSATLYAFVTLAVMAFTMWMQYLLKSSNFTLLFYLGFVLQVLFIQTASLVYKGALKKASTLLKIVMIIGTLAAASIYFTYAI